jgi:hypothetical protein
MGLITLIILITFLCIMNLSSSQKFVNGADLLKEKDEKENKN